MKLFLHRFDLQLRHTFTIAHDSRDVQPTLIVELNADGISGYGEATSNTYYGVTVPAMEAALQSLRPLIERYEWGSPEELWELTLPYLQNNPFAHCALDEAAHDYYARLHGQKLYESWGLKTGNNPPTNYTIGIDTVEKMVEKLREFPWPLYKIKLGTDHDLDIVRELRRHTDARFRVDANCAWTAAQTIACSAELKELNVEFIEQPLPASDSRGMKQVYEHSEIPVIADESCIGESDVLRCRGLFHGVNIKLTKCGGLTPARRMIRQAKALGLQTMVGCMTESSVGISAIAHLLPLLDYVDMDGSLLLRDDPATGVTFDYGTVIYSAENGTGARLKNYSST